MMNKGHIMKKTFYSVIFAVFLTVWNVKPVAATIIIDGTEFAGKTAEWAQVLLDSGGKNIQQVMQDALMHGQGFAVDMLKEYITGFIKNAINKDKGSTFEKVEDSTQKKNTAIKENDKDAYQKGIKAEYNKKYEIASAELAKDRSDLSNYTSQCNTAKITTREKKQAYEEVRGQAGKEEAAFDEYSKAQSHETDVCNTVEELNAKIAEQQVLVDMLRQEMLKVGTSADPKYKEMQRREDEIKQNVVDETLITAKDESNNAWDNIDAEKYTPEEEEYKNFYDRYFYNPEGANTDVITSQTKREKIKRERDFLLVNATAHLLQVSASARREVPVRSHLVKEISANTKTESGEMAALNAFAQTKIENARALLLYAKLLSAKLQYIAAHDLYKADIYLERDDITPDGVQYGAFDLQHYVLTDGYTQYLVDVGNNADVTNRMSSVKEENTEWRPR